MAGNNEVGLSLVIDESNVSSELRSISSDLGRIDQQANSTEKSLNDAFRAGNLRGYENQANRTTAANNRLDNSVKRTTRSQSRNVRATNAATAALGRYVGVNNKAISGIRGVGTAMAATPFGLFIAGFTTAATVMEFFGFSLFDTTSEMDELIESTKKLNEETEKLNKQNEEVASKQLIDRLKAQGAAAEEVAEATAKITDKQRQENRRLINDLFEQENVLVTQISALQNKIVGGNDSVSKAINEAIKIRIDALEAERKQTVAIRTKLSLENQDLNTKELEREKEQSKKRAELAKRRRENAIKEQERLAKELQAIQEKILKEELKTRLELITDGEQKEIETRIQQAKERENSVRGLFNRQLEILEEQATEEEKKSGEFAIKTADLARQQAEILKGIEQAKQNDIKEIRAKFRSEEVNNFKDFLQNIINQSLESTKKQIEIERLKLSAQQEIDKQKFFEVERSEKEIANFLKGQNEARLRNEIDLQVQILEAVLKAGKNKTKIEKDLIKAQIQELKAQRDSIGLDQSATKEKGSNIFSLLGIDISPDAQKAAIEELKKLGNLVFDELSKQAARRSEIAQQQVAESNKEIERLNQNLQREETLLRNGDAANIERQKQALEEQDKIRKEALEEQRKAQQLQFAIDTASQTANLITASSEIFKNLSSGFPYTLPLAIGSVAAMFGAFAASRAQAAKAVGFAEGGVIPLGRDDRQRTENGYRIGNTNMFVGGGEHITPVAQTRQSIGLLEAIRKGELTDLDFDNLHKAKNKDFNRVLANVKKRKERVNREVYREAVREAIKDQTSELGQHLKTLVSKPTIIQMPNGTVIKEYDDGKGNKSRVEIKG